MARHFTTESIAERVHAMGEGEAPGPSSPFSEDPVYSCPILTQPYSLQVRKQEFGCKVALALRLHLASAHRGNLPIPTLLLP